MPRQITIPVGAVTLAEAERMVIEAQLIESRGNVAEAARVLEVNRNTIARKLGLWYARKDEANP